MLNDLNEQQYYAATYDGNAQNILVVAGAGTGKTKTMISRAYYLLAEKKIEPSRILCLTFTNRAAKEIVGRLEAVVPDSVESVWASTFHSFCIKVIKQIPNSFGYESLPTIIDAGSQNTLMKACYGTVLDQLDPPEEIRSILPKVSNIASEYSFARNAQRSVEQQFKHYLSDFEEVIDFSLKVVEEYEREKEEYGYVDFDDILIRFAEKVEEKPRLAEAISDMFDEVLVDELQDTNPVQYRILRLLSNGNARVFGVGDPAQSIYGFRGAEFESIFFFEKYFKNSERINLFVNYRSYQEILDVSNGILDNSTYDFDNKLKADRGSSGSRSELRDFESNVEEATFISKDIIKHRDNGGNYSDIFVITRSAFSARDIEMAFKQKNIPYEFVGGMAINKTRHVQDMMGILQMATNRQDKLATIRFLSMFKGVGDKTAFKGYMKLKDIEGNDEYIDTIERLVKKDSERAGAIMRSTMEAIDQSVNPIRAMLKNGFESLLKDTYADTYEYRIEDIKMIAETFKQYKGEVQQFLSDFTLEPSINKYEDDSESKDLVTIITAHSAKGLEKEVCYVTKVSPGTFPSKRAIGSRKSEEEERRVAYVAMTRARDRLVVTRTEEHLNTFFGNAKTNIDFIGPITHLFDKKKKKMIANTRGLSGLKDIF